ncbi:MULTISPECIES: hypothetical protein [Bradyrhizobium]|uniref:Glutamine amidotransferase domain-containing protein n=1 Tax=Bradyrhizobium guangdongense TaxID=1325090 RepID=A0AA88BC73_9BRAD|nr:hypothetical protein GCM10010987_63450 [Bradyrhizobium guangdongense]
MIAIIDNYDSFAFNIARYFRELDQATEVVRNDLASISDLVGLKPRAVSLVLKLPVLNLDPQGTSPLPDLQFAGLISVHRVSAGKGGKRERRLTGTA